MAQAKLSPPYDSVRHAYQHLLKYDGSPNLPKEAPKAPVTLHVRNDYIHYRPYESFEAISRFMTSDIFHSNVIVCVEHLRDEFRPLQVRKMYRMITGSRFPQDDCRDVYDVVWALFQQPKITVMKAKNKGRQGNSYLFDLSKMISTEVNFPKQCKIAIAAFITAERSSYTLDELRFFANDLHKHGLKTKQDPWKVLQYYLPQLHDAGLLEYPRKQYNTDDEEEQE